MNPLEYFVYAVSIIEENSYYQPTIKDWARGKADAINRAREAKTHAEIHTLLRDFLSEIGDRHSHLIAPGQQDPPARMPDGHMIDQWGYVRLPVAAGDDDLMQRYAEIGHDLVGQMARARGWIVDLRKNVGGNMWPMLAAIGPLAGEGILGHFIDRDAQQIAWGYRQGASFYEQENVYEVSCPVEVVSSECPVAILTSDQTASSGEILLVSFLGRDNVRVFGQATRGIPTANDIYPLDDNTLLVLTRFITADSRGKTYEAAIAPHVVCENALEAATGWLSGAATT